MFTGETGLMEPQGVLKEADVKAILDRMAIEEDEEAVFSFAARVGTEGLDLVFASVLFACSDVAQASWPEWSAEQRASMATLLAMWEQAGVDVSAWSSFVEERNGWVFGRRVLGSDDVVSWLTSLLTDGGAEIPDGPLVSAQTRAATGLIRTFEHSTSPASLLTSAAHRPTTGYFFTIVTDITAADGPTTWDVDGYPLPSPGLWVLGLPLAEPPLHSKPFDPDAVPVPGLYVGRLERRAWIADLRAEPGSDLFRIGLGFDERRISLAELEIDLEEFADGELIAARRLRLGDIALPPGPLALGEQIVVGMPSVGPRLHRQVRLYDRDGVLLDTSDRAPTIEKIEFVATVDDGAEAVAGAVGGAPAVSLLERLALADGAEAAYVKLLEDGLAGRVIDDPTTGMPLLAGMLQEAQADLSVLDPYFGWSVGDWQVLAHAAGSVRVLTGHGHMKKNGTIDQRVTVPPAGTAPGSASFEVRSWRSGTPPWHDRVYLWPGGGLSVGTSPSGLGKRVARIDRMTAIEAAGWQNLFNTWWAGGDVAPV